MGFSVSDEAVEQLKATSAKLAESKKTIEASVQKLSNIYEQNKEGLGNHSDDILDLINDLQQLTKNANGTVIKLAMKLNQAAAIRKSHMENNVYAGLGDGAGGSSGGLGGSGALAGGIAGGVVAGAAAGGIFSIFKKDKGNKFLPQEDHSNVPEATSPQPTYEKSTDEVMNDWPRIKETLQLREDLLRNNPNYKQGSLEWGQNCQRCVPCYEMRRRGYDVTVTPRQEVMDYLALHPFDAWEGAQVNYCKGNGYDDIKSLMDSWGDGARGQVVLSWTKTSGHTFYVEKKGDNIIFSDPQTGQVHVDYYLDQCIPGSVQIARIDNLKPSKWIEKCCKPRA